ncbi:MAG: response regulator [Trueperaceae bacterium]
MRTVLIADSDAFQRQLVDMLLAVDNYRLFGFDTGRALLEHMQAHVPDLVIVDYALPDINGADVCAKMRKVKRLANVSVILVTAAHKLSVVRGVAGAVQANLVLAKPLGDKHLRKHVGELLNAQETSSAVAESRPTLQNKPALQGNPLLEQALSNIRTSSSGTLSPFLSSPTLPPVFTQGDFSQSGFTQSNLTQNNPTQSNLTQDALNQRNVTQGDFKQNLNLIETISASEQNLLKQPSPFSQRNINAYSENSKTPILLEREASAPYHLDIALHAFTASQDTPAPATVQAHANAALEALLGTIPMVNPTPEQSAASQMLSSQHAPLKNEALSREVPTPFEVPAAPAPLLYEQLAQRSSLPVESNPPSTEWQHTAPTPWQHPSWHQDAAWQASWQKADSIAHDGGISEQELLESLNVPFTPPTPEHILEIDTFSDTLADAGSHPHLNPPPFRNTPNPAAPSEFSVFGSDPLHSDSDEILSLHLENNEESVDEVQTLRDYVQQIKDENKRLRDLLLEVERGQNLGESKSYLSAIEELEMFRRLSNIQVKQLDSLQQQNQKLLEEAQTPPERKRGFLRFLLKSPLA